MKRITKEEFIKAIDIIEKYSEQLNQTISKSKTSVKKFLEVVEPNLRRGLNYNDIRVYNALKSCKFEYMEDITNKEFLKFRNIGKSCLDTFEEFKKMI